MRAFVLLPVAGLLVAALVADGNDEPIAQGGVGEVHATSPEIRSSPPPDESDGFLVSDEPGRWGGGSPEAVKNFDYVGLPGRLANPSLRALWRQGLDLERRGRLLESAHRYESIVSAVPEEAYTYWRTARNYWRIGENFPVDLKLERGRYFDLSEEWAERGLAVDPNCAACMLWKFVSMGRQATTRGLLTAAGDVREMDELLRRGIGLAPRHRDNEGNMTMGNLYYAGSVFYRVMPEWWWLKWLVGVRGDKEKSLEYARHAVALAPVRIDYKVELGASLLCLGLDEGDSRRMAEGEQVLEAVRHLGEFLSTDPLDKTHAEILIASPDRACGYSRDGFIDVEGLGKQVRAGG
jgi:tetratricopeptide (TPR) repeat protein